MIARQNENKIWHIASSSKKHKAQALRGTRPTINITQHVNRFDTRSDMSNAAQKAQYDLNSMEQESVRNHLSRIGTINESVHASVH